MLFVDSDAKKYVGSAHLKISDIFASDQISDMTKKQKRKRHLKPYVPIRDELPIESDHYFAFIMGYTSGGAAYGITHEDWAKIQEENLKSKET